SLLSGSKGPICRLILFMDRINSGNVGSTDEPAIIIINSNTNLTAGATIRGVVYLRGCNRKISGPVGYGEKRATIVGSVLFGAPDECSDNSSVTGAINIVYDQNIIRKA